MTKTRSKITSEEIEAGMEIFQQFIFADRMSEEEMLSLIFSAITLGKDHADQIIEEFGVQKPRILLKQLGVQMKQEELPLTLQNEYVKFAEFSPKSNRIFLNQGALQKLSEKIPVDLAEDIILCHELYHYFEVNQWGLTSEYFMKTVKLFGIFPVRRKMLPAAEIAANSFTKTYLDLDFHPQIIEKLYFQ